MATEHLEATPEQLFWVNGSWIPASDLRPGDQFMTADGRNATVTNITPVEIAENASCYGLQTEAPHDFFANGVLARDCTPPSGRFSSMSKRAHQSQQRIHPVDRPWDLLLSPLRPVMDLLRRLFAR
jgi:hypothetical protein